MIYFLVTYLLSSVVAGLAFSANDFSKAGSFKAFAINSSAQIFHPCK